MDDNRESIPVASSPAREHEPSAAEREAGRSAKATLVGSRTWRGFLAGLGWILRSRVLVVVPAAILVALLADGLDASDWFRGETFGQIRIDTPQVYTRERLVND